METLINNLSVDRLIYISEILLTFDEKKKNHALSLSYVRSSLFPGLIFIRNVQSQKQPQRTPHPPNKKQKQNKTKARKKARYFLCQLSVREFTTLFL